MNDKNNIGDAMIAVENAVAALRKCAQTDNVLLFEHVIEMIEPMANTEQKLQRLLSALEVR